MEYSNTYLFADDTIISVCDHDIGAINSKLNKDLAYVNHWARLNKLIINTEKTYSILFITSQRERRVNTDIFKLYLNKLMLARVFEGKIYLTLISHLNRMSYQCVKRSTRSLD